MCMCIAKTEILKTYIYIFFSIQRAYERLKQNLVKFKYTQVINLR